MSSMVFYFAGIFTGIVAALSVPETIKDIKHIISTVKVWMG